MVDEGKTRRCCFGTRSSVCPNLVLSIVDRAQHQAGKKSKWCNLLLQSLGLEQHMEPGRAFGGGIQALASNDQRKDPAERGKAWRIAMQSKPKLRTSAPEEQSVFRGILEAPRPKSKGGDDAPNRIEKGRHRVTNRDQILHERERVCRFVSGEVDDECHFLIDCVEYEDLREKMFRIVRAKEVRKDWQSKAHERYHRRWSGEHVCGSGCSESGA